MRYIFQSTIAIAFALIIALAISHIVQEAGASNAEALAKCEAIHSHQTCVSALR